MKEQEQTLLLPPERAEEAGELVRRGKLAVFPTETVYGLGADALNGEACGRVFRAKGRPADNPLIVHLPDLGSLDALFPTLDRRARALFDAFAPGPLSVIVSKSAAGSPICEAATAGLDTVAIRIPRHPVATAFLRAAGVPVAAPSANLSGRPSPTTFDMAVADMMGRVAAILDGGDCEVGLESTVIDLRGGGFTILRHGVITDEMVLRVLGRGERAVEVGEQEQGTGTQSPRSPGMKYSHYKPRAEVAAVESAVLRGFAGAEALLREFSVGGDEPRLVGLIRLGSGADAVSRISRGAVDGARHLFSGRNVRAEGRLLTVTVRDVRQYARDLYRLLVWFDAQGVDSIAAELPPATGTGRAVRDRLLKASGGRIIGYRGGAAD